MNVNNERIADGSNGTSSETSTAKVSWKVYGESTGSLSETSSIENEDNQSEDSIQEFPPGGINDILPGGARDERGARDEGGVRDEGGARDEGGVRDEGGTKELKEPKKAKYGAREDAPSCKFWRRKKIHSRTRSQKRIHSISRSKSRRRGSRSQKRLKRRI